MRLIKPQPVRETEAPSPASVFAEKYDWLLRWAMHFTQNDRTLSEDLVQDAFVRLIVAWPRIKDNIAEVEPFLYSTLKYAHLMELRRGRRVSFQDIALIEFDDLCLSLKEEKGADPIAVQDDLRRIVAYLCWRKRTVKSASILLLRFFHGYFPEEVARIAIMRQRSTNELLRVARLDVKAYMADPSSVEMMHQGKVPELMPRRVAVPQERFAEELRSTIAQAQGTPCLSREQLTAHYERVNPQPISGELLAHLVSCDRCLSVVHSLFNFPTRTDGIVNASLNPKPKSGKDAKASPEEIRRSMAAGMERFRKLYEHHPRALMIAVNGEVIAMRDVSSATSELKVQAPLERSLGMIDVLSEQGITLLTLYVPAGPPEAPPEVRHEIALSENRKLDLLVSFTSAGAVIELHYSDPLFQSLPAAADLDELAEDASADSSGQPLALTTDGKPRRTWRKWLSDWFANLPMPEMSPLFATAMACGLAAIVLFALSLHRSSVMKPSELLNRATASAAASVKTGQTGVVMQTVRIQTPRRKFERTVYRDAEGRRRPKPKTLNGDDATLESALAVAGVSWDDPLSPASFDYWHGHEHVRQDIVSRSGEGLLTLKTTVDDGNVASESLTVREADFHTVAKTIELRDRGTIEIAEVSYGIFPWNSINPDLFEPTSLTPAGAGIHPALMPHLAAPVTDTQLDEAELAVRLVLNHLQMDDSNEVSLHRQPDAIHVQGVVASQEEKQRLQTELRPVPHVVTAIATVAEMDLHPPAGSEITSVKQTSDSSAPSSLDRFLAERGVDHAKAGTEAQQFINSSFAAKHESQALAELLEHFGQDDQLSPSARTALSQLVVQHKAALLNALQAEERQLTALNLASGESTAATGPITNDAQALRGAAEKNFALCVELTLGSNDSARPAQNIAPQLVASIAELRTVTLRISAASHLSASSADNSAPNHESR